jgi:hypothetical protein
MRRRLARLGLHSVRRFPAVDGGQVARPAAWTGRPGAYGCLQSHLAVARAARNAGVPCVLVLEDDAVLDAAWRSRLDAAWPQLPDDWDLLYLGCNHFAPPRPVADGLARVVQAHSTFAYILRHTAYDVFLAVNRRPSQPLDVNLLQFQQDRACYALWPNAAWVDEDYSDVQDAHESYWYLRESVLVTPGALGDLAGRLLLVIPRSAAAWRPAAPETATFLVHRFAEAFPGLDVAVGAGHPPPAQPDHPFAGARADVFDWPDVPLFPGFGTSPPVPGDRLQALADRLGGRYRFLLCAGSPVLLPTRLLRAAVQMCRRYDLVLPFRHARPLSPGQTRELLAGRSRWFDPVHCPGPGQSARRLHWWFFDLEAARRHNPSTANVHPLSLFRAPCLALQLTSDRFGVRPERESPHP